MMSVHGESMTVLSEDESWHLLASMALGRLVTCLEGQPAIFPVNFVVMPSRGDHGRHVYIVPSPLMMPLVSRASRSTPCRS